MICGCFILVSFSFVPFLCLFFVFGTVLLLFWEKIYEHLFLTQLNVNWSAGLNPTYFKALYLQLWSLS